MSIKPVMPSNHLILCRPLLLLPSIFPSIRVFSNESALHIRWPKYWSFSFNISPSNEHPGLISFSIGWLDLLVVQGMLKSLLQHHSSKASILQLPLKKRDFLKAYINIPRKLRNYHIHSTRAEFFGKRIKNKKILLELKKINFIKMLEDKVEQIFCLKSKTAKSYTGTNTLFE